MVLVSLLVTVLVSIDAPALKKNPHQERRTRCCWGVAGIRFNRCILRHNAPVAMTRPTGSVPRGIAFRRIVYLANDMTPGWTGKVRTTGESTCSFVGGCSGVSGCWGDALMRSSSRRMNSSTPWVAGRNQRAKTRPTAVSGKYFSNLYVVTFVTWGRTLLTHSSRFTFSFRAAHPAHSCR